MTAGILLTTLIAVAPPAAAHATAPESLQSPRLPPTTVMERQMDDLRRELVALAGDAQAIRAADGEAKQRALLSSHLARLRDSLAAMQAMESRMHDALARGHVASDPGARGRHEFLFRHIEETVNLVQGVLARPPAPEAERK